MNKNKEKSLACLGLIALTAAIIPARWLFSGWALSVLWGWCITPVFESAPSLSIWPAVGVTTVVNFITYPSELNQLIKDPDKGFAYSFAWAFIRPVISVAMGWILYNVFIT